MKKHMGKKTAVILSSFLIGAQILTGCGGAAPAKDTAPAEAPAAEEAAQEEVQEEAPARVETALELYDLFRETYEENYHYTGEMNLNMTVTMDMSGLAEEGEEAAAAGTDSTMEMKIPVSLSYDMDILDKLGHGDMTMEMSLFGESNEMAAEVYADMTGDEPLVYTCQTSENGEAVESPQWTVSNSTSGIMMAGDEEASRKMMESAQLTYEEGTGYLVTIDTSTYMDTTGNGEVFESLSGVAGIDPEALEESLRNTSVVYTFTDDYCLQSIRMDSFSYTMDMDTSQTGAPTKVQMDMDFSMDMTGYGTVTEDMVKVPDEVKASAVSESEED